MNPTPENIDARSRFLTKRFVAFMKDRYVQGHGVKVGDELTKTLSDYPKAFRVGKCTLDESKSNADIQVLLFWRDDQRSDQRELRVKVIQEGTNWLVNDIELSN